LIKLVFYIFLQNSFSALTFKQDL